MCLQLVFLPFPFRSSYALSLMYGVCVFGKIHYDVVIVVRGFFFCASHDFPSFLEQSCCYMPKKANTTSEQQQQNDKYIYKKTESINNLRSAYSPCDVVDIVRYLWPLAV